MKPDFFEFLQNHFEALKEPDFSVFHLVEPVAPKKTYVQMPIWPSLYSDVDESLALSPPPSRPMLDNFVGDREAYEKAFLDYNLLKNHWLKNKKSKK